MKKKIAVIALLLLTVFTLIQGSEPTKVNACDAPLPHADLPEPTTCG